MPSVPVKSFSKLLNSMTFIFLLGISAPAHALEGNWAESEYLKARIVTGQNTTGTTKTINAALDLEMKPDWHIYWRMPGDGGLAPSLGKGESQNLKDIAIKWPTPIRFEFDGLYGFGYKDAALLPLTVTPEEPGKPVKLALKADIMVCNAICVPQKLDLTLDIPAGDVGLDEAQDKRLQTAQKKLPYTENRPDMKIENVVMGPTAIVVRAYLSQGFEGADLFVEGPDSYVVAPPTITPETKDPRYASMVINAPEGVDNLAASVMGKTLTLTLTNKKGQALERSFDF